MEGSAYDFIGEDNELQKLEKKVSFKRILIIVLSALFSIALALQIFSLRFLVTNSYVGQSIASAVFFYYFISNHFFLSLFNIVMLILIKVLNKNRQINEKIFKTIKLFIFDVSIIIVVLILMKFYFP